MPGKKNEIVYDVHFRLGDETKTKTNKRTLIYCVKVKHFIKTNCLQFYSVTDSRRILEIQVKKGIQLPEEDSTVRVIYLRNTACHGKI
jgi:hypothetical protein